MLAVALQDLRLEPGDRFLEVGACTGYLCALAAWLTGRQVTGVEIDWSLVRETGPRLAQAGADVWLPARDAERGLPDGTWDKITASFAVPSIPASWLHRLAPGGRLRTTINGGAPGWHATALVQRGIAGALTGTLTAELWGHVPSRRVGWLPVPSPPDGPGRTRCAVLPPPAHTQRGFWVAVGHLLPGVRRYWDPAGSGEVVLVGADGSRAVIAPDGATASEWGRAACGRSPNGSTTAGLAPVGRRSTNWS
ncbi:hypothetical protein [Kitasatospora sp. NPDC088779]|uniref:protein-L-isoaspartate O-methyltransferase family protein n=1 Tax=Kitasatospora sp. NPDC088779 TaxID=3154964 RepID=UPI003444A5E6